MLDVDGRFFITGTPGPRDWFATCVPTRASIVHLKRRAGRDLAGTAQLVDDHDIRRRVIEHLSAH